MVQRLSCVILSLLGPVLLGVESAAAAATDDPNSADRLETVVVEATRLGGPEISPTGANDYAVTASDITP